MTGRNSPGRRCLVAIALLTSSGAAACSPSPPSDSHAPVLAVVTALYPLALAAEKIGGGQARVTDVVPAGSDPLTFRPSVADEARIDSAGLVVEVGDGFQPGFETAAASARRTLALRRVDPAASDGYVWLDPSDMESASASLATAMEAADPGAASSFRTAATAFQAELASVDSDFQSVLSTCPRQTIVEPGSALAAMARTYGLTDISVGPAADASGVAAAESAVRDRSLTTVFSEPWVDDTGVSLVASATKSVLRRVDTFAVAPVAAPPGGSGYVNLIETDLGALSAALGCPDAATS